MKNLTNETQRHFALILTLAGLISMVILAFGTAKVASAQTIYPSWSYTGNLNAPRRGFTATLLPNGRDFVGAEMVKAFVVSSEYRRRFGP